MHHSPQQATLLLSSINLPGGVQRRRTTADELNMRHFFVENDLISAEVQSFFADGAMSLHTRSSKYGKLRYGQLAKVTPSLIKRCAQHMQSLPCNVDIILGMNGFLWIQSGGRLDMDSEEREKATGDEDAKTLEAHDAGRQDWLPSAEAREAIARVQNAALALDSAFVAIHPDTIMSVYESSKRAQVSVADMLDNVAELTADAAAMHLEDEA